MLGHPIWAVAFVINQTEQKQGGCCGHYGLPQKALCLQFCNRQREGKKKLLNEWLGKWELVCRCVCDGWKLLWHPFVYFSSPSFHTRTHTHTHKHRPHTLTGHPRSRKVHLGRYRTAPLLPFSSLAPKTRRNTINTKILIFLPLQLFSFPPCSLPPPSRSSLFYTHHRILLA